MQKGGPTRPHVHLQTLSFRAKFDPPSFGGLNAVEEPAFAGRVMNQWIAVAVAEKVGVIETASRRNRSQPSGFLIRISGARLDVGGICAPFAWSFAGQALALVKAITIRCIAAVEQFGDSLKTLRPSLGPSDRILLFLYHCEIRVQRWLNSLSGSSQRNGQILTAHWHNSNTIRTTSCSVTGNIVLRAGVFLR
jgi:hypothetical protein